MTRSENLFEDFCRLEGIACERIAEGQSKSPDYVVHLSSASVVVELKEIALNPEEANLLRVPLEEWDPSWTYHWGVPGERIRNKITKSIPQLRALCQGSYPGLLLIYNSVSFWPELADGYAVKVAMYGIETAFISPEAAAEGGAQILARWHGQRKKLTCCQNTTLSAVGIMEDADGITSINCYHNYFARNPIPPEALRFCGIRQFTLKESPEGCFPEWQELLLDPSRER